MGLTQYRRRTSEEVLREIERLRKARHKIFLGAAAGVGKTYAMLSEAESLRHSDVDVVAGIIEPHHRPETEALLAGLEMVPTLQVPYHGMTLPELDVAAVIRRQPDVVLVDELAHTNAPGGSHRKRFEDVQEILEAGINVHSTLNIQHLESLNDVVFEITGVRVRETVPDSVVQEAQEIRLIDLAPEALISRLKQGKIYAEEQAKQALQNFFRMGNLTALRELVLRTVADTAEEDLDAYMRAKNIQGPWRTKECVLVCVTPSPSGQVLIRRGYRMAQRLKGDFYVATVTDPSHPMDLERATGLDLNLKLAHELGATVVQAQDVRVASRLVEIANQAKATQIVLGESAQSRWQELRHGSVIWKILKETTRADVLIVAR
ncbi:MAG: universal stress protein [Sulfobacillus sp.]